MSAPTPDNVRRLVRYMARDGETLDETLLAVDDWFAATHGWPLPPSEREKRRAVRVAVVTIYAQEAARS